MKKQFVWNGPGDCCFFHKPPKDSPSLVSSKIAHAMSSGELFLFFSVSVICNHFKICFEKIHSMRQRFGRIEYETIYTYFIYITGRILIQNSGYLWMFASILNCIERSMGTAALTCLFSAICSWRKKLPLFLSEFLKGMGWLGWSAEVFQIPAVSPTTL